MTSTAPDLEARLRRDLSELAAIPAPIRARRPHAERPRRPVATVVLAAAVVIVLLAAGIGIAQLASRDASSVRPAHGTESVPRPGPTTSNTGPITATSPTTPSAGKSTPTTLGIAIEQVDWDTVALPLASRCGSTFTPPVTVQQVDYITPVPAEGGEIAIVLARCNSGAGTPSSALYVYESSGGTPTSPHLAATLVTATDNWQARDFTAAGSILTMAANGFSSDTVPRCCADVHTTLTWRWNGVAYAVEGTPPPHVTFPG